MNYLVTIRLKSDQNSQPKGYVVEASRLSKFLDEHLTSDTLVIVDYIDTY